LAYPNPLTLPSHTNKGNPPKAAHRDAHAERRRPTPTRSLRATSNNRLLHHAHLITTQGDSHRLQQALAGKGVKALT
jgi:hypothetical protein